MGTHSTPLAAEPTTLQNATRRRRTVANCGSACDPCQSFAVANDVFAAFARSRIAKVLQQRQRAGQVPLEAFQFVLRLTRKQVDQAALDALPLEQRVVNLLRD